MPKFIDGLAALVELASQVSVVDPVFFAFLNKIRNRVKILYREYKGLYLWLKRRDKRNPLPIDLPRIEIFRERPGHEIRCLCGCSKHTIGADVCKQLEIARMQIRVTKHVLKVYGCCDCEMASVTAGKPVQLIEKESPAQVIC